MALQEAKHDSSRRKLEADLRADFEKQVSNMDACSPLYTYYTLGSPMCVIQMSEQMSEARQRQATNEEEIRERHRRQVLELNSRHTREMEELVRQFQEDARRKDEKMHQQIIDYEERWVFTR